MTTFRTLSGTATYAGIFGNSELVHLLKRSLFGVKQADLLAFQGKSLITVVDTLLTPAATPAPPVNNYNDSNYTDANVAAGQTWVNAPYTDGATDSRRTTSLKAWWLGRMLNQQQSIEEKMVLFLHNHFSTQTATIGDARYEYKHNALLRQYALGNFKQLVKQITLDPAMLRYLNGYQNVKTSPNENYGRELQELFTIGKGPNSKYTEDDVKTVAKVLTGYNVNAATISSAFDATRHDTTNKQFSAFYGNKLITSKVNAAGATELDDMLDMIFATNECALYICRRLYRFFVYYIIDDATEANVIAPLATIFRNNNYEIKPVLKALLTSDHFFDRLNSGCMIKSPIDFHVGVCRDFGIVFPADTDYVNAYYMWDYIRTQSAIIAQNIGDPPNVSGWAAYYQEPEYHELWINTDTLPKRNQFTDTMVANGYTRNGKKIGIDVIAYTSTLPNPADPNALVSDVLAQLYAVTVSQQVKDFLKAILLSSQLSDHYWSDAWNAYKSLPTDAINKGTVIMRLTAFYKYIMDLSEYQLS
ncbi:DUF1800 domain-containing protein [Mucilaginibacter sp.]|uniref:DUF1800 domain-containing protein n=1 Tax=Mucilaginibacter sp. TaxID=1882438 RepID=UPI00261187F5|nr:DUF1800 domain-containing protein [Mucilaginibacter sp.]MDB4925453.1 hypothetical protein [Mucilaginibacter sp.]